MNIAMYFGISLDCIICGKFADDNTLEKRLCGSNDFPLSSGISRIISRYNALSDSDKDRLTGYLDALLRGNNM